MPEFRVSDPSRSSGDAAGSSDSLRESFVRLQQAEQLRQRGRLDEARSICESLLQRHPDYSSALHTLGLVFGDKEDHQQALNYLVRASMLQPRNWMTLAALSGVYLRLGAVAMAKQAIGQARLIAPQEGSVMLLQGDIFREDCEYELARKAYGQAVAIDPTLAPAGIGLGWCLADLGEYRPAAEMFEKFIERGLRSVEPLRALASLPAEAVRVDLLRQLEGVRREPGEAVAQFESAIAFIRATGLDRAGRHAEAWEQATRANRSVFMAMQASLKRLDERRRASIASLRNHSRDGESLRGGDARPISLFILGPSRSGKTTMERLVSRLAGVKRGYENPIVENMVRDTFQVSGLPPDSTLGQLPAPAHPLCRALYREELARRMDTETVFTNTNPGCIFEAHHIASLFENVRFIFMKRSLQDNLLEIYMREYQAGNPYAYDLNAAHEHVRWCHAMADLMARKFPEVVRVVNYEEMIADPIACMRMAAGLCGLPLADGPPPPVGGTSGCSAPYRQLMAAELRT